LPDLPDIDDTVPLPDPDADAPDVTVATGRIELAQPVFFDTDRKRIHHRYFDELRQLASVIERHREWTTIWIEGHTDAAGPEEWNQTLSRNRALSVAAFLVAHGIDAARLRPVGFGEARPLVQTAPGVANDKNRRVHFFTDVVPDTSPMEVSQK
jgi:outer membrane protein OmpA-like peptidoglycan-associated protein